MLKNKTTVTDGRRTSELVLINLENDPYELFNVYDQYKDIAAEMIATITARGMYVQI